MVGVWARLTLGLMIALVLALGLEWMYGFKIRI